MKLIALLLPMAFCGALIPATAQSVSVSGKNLTLKKVFSIVKEQTGYGMFANKGLLEQTAPVTVAAERMQLTDFLNLVLREQPVAFRIEDRIIILSEKKTIVKKEAPVSNMASVLSGRIVDIEGKPLPGASVQLKGSVTGVFTDNEGKFTLSHVPSNAVLEVSSVGYRPAEVKVKSVDELLQISMVQAIRELEETVIIAYGSVKKKDLTGSVVSVKEGDITATPVNNVMEALQGKVAGMDIMRGSGAVGTNVDVLLRGNRSIYGDNSPLYIVDGIQSSYSQVNPSDIATIDILKDASSTAIYGSAGANGVVIITTKKGKANKPIINIDAFYGFSGTPHFFHSMIGDEYVQYRREIYRTNNGVYPQDPSQLFSGAVLDAYQAGKWIDWVGLITDNRAKQQKYNLSFSGGSARTQMYTSFLYTKEDGLLSNENKRVFGARLNIDHEAARWAKTGANMNASYTVKNARGRNIFTGALSALPLGDPYDAAGNINPVFIDGETTPLGDQLPNQFADNTRDVFVNLNTYLELKPFKGFSFRSVLGATLNNSRNGRYWGKQAASNVVNGYAAPLAAIYDRQGYGYTWENIATWNKTVAAHQFTVTGITSWATYVNESNNSLGQGQSLDYYQFYNLGNGTQKMGIASYYEQKQRLSFAGRVNYSLMGRYLLTLTNRWDGVSHLADGHKWSSFPAAAVAWRLSDEQFMFSSRKWINELKLRAGYGVTGNSGGMSAYSSQTQAITYQVISLDGTLVPNIQNTGTYSNPSISWERSYNLNIGADIMLFNKRLELTADRYNTDTKGLLFKRKLPVTAAVTAWGSPLFTWQNIGATNNKGWEFTLRTLNITRPGLEWTTAFSFTANKETIVSLPDGDVVSERLFQGYPINTHHDYQYLGIWSLKEEAEAAAYGAKPGYVKVATNEKFDANGIGDKGVHSYTTTDKRILGSNVPKWLLGINNNVVFKNFDLGLFTMIRWGQMINSSLIGWYTAEDEGQPAGVDYWTPENETAYYPRPGIAGRTGIEALRYVDGSFVKLKTITLGYSLPERLAKRACMNKARMYVTAYNPWVFTRNKDLKGTDPETNGSDSFPLFATFVMGLNISF